MCNNKEPSVDKGVCGKAETVIVRKPLLSHAVIVKAPGLLPMLYSLPELADEISLSPQTLRDWLAFDLPHRRDNADHIWINGRAFADWVQRIRTTRRKVPLAPGQAFCLRCKQPVALSEPSSHQTGKQVRWSGTCPLCGTKIHRGGRHGQ
jgi:hypothetical protein